MKSFIKIQTLVYNTNDLRIQKIYGKTGTGKVGKYCFAGYCEDMVVIVLGAQSREICNDKAGKLIKELKKMLKK